MIAEMFKICFCNHCAVFICDDGTIGCKNKGMKKCDTCQYYHEKTVFDCNDKKPDFETFCKIFNFLKQTELRFSAKEDFYQYKRYCLIADIFGVHPINDKKARLMTFLNFCVKNNIYKKWSLKELKKILEERFREYED